jgi:hypothetical protein
MDEVLLFSVAYGILYRAMMAYLPSWGWPEEERVNRVNTTVVFTSR